MNIRVCVCVCVFVAGEQIRKRRCKAAFSYLPQHEDELELKAGDVIEILAEVRAPRPPQPPRGLEHVAFYSKDAEEAKRKEGSLPQD